jgi:hypothetical protein
MNTGRPVVDQGIATNLTRDNQAWIRRRHTVNLEQDAAAVPYESVSSTVSLARSPGKIIFPSPITTGNNHQAQLLDNAVGQQNAHQRDASAPAPTLRSATAVGPSPVTAVAFQPS